MKKYLLCLVLIAGLIITGSNVAHAESFVQNTITNSQVQQYILINCQGDECLQLVKAFKKINQWQDIVEATELPSGSPAEIVEESSPNVDNVQAVKKNNAPLVEGTSQTVVVINEEAASGNNPASEPVSGNNIVEQNEIAQSVQTEATDSAISDGNETATLAMAVEKKIAVGAKQIRISEVMSTPASGASEWVELYNSLDFPVDLSGWQLIEGAGKITKLVGVVNANNFIVFEKDSLNNSGDSIILKDPTDAIIDSVSYGDWNDGNAGDNAPKTANGQSLILSEGNYFIAATPTPNLPNVLPSSATLAIQESASSAGDVQTPSPAGSSESIQQKAAAVQVPAASASTAAVSVESAAKQNAEAVYQFSDKVFISEFLADPAGSDDDEWIELFNDGVESVDLLGWSLDDAEGGSQPYLIKEPTVISGKNFILFKKEKTGLVLNNAADSVVLRDPAEKEISRFDYKNIKEGFSFAQFLDGWQETTILTPGALNQKATLQVAQLASAESVKTAASSINKKTTVFRSISADKAKEIALGATVNVQGAVVALPGVFGKTIAYIDGLQIYYSKAEWPALKIGDIIFVRGIISENSGERRLIVKKNNDIQVIKESALIEPLKISSIDVSKDIVGKLVRFNGELVEKKQNKLILADEAGEFVVYLKNGARIDQKIYELSNKLEIQGIVSAFDNELRILPRGKDDIMNLSLQKIDLPSDSIVSQTQSDSEQKKTFIFLLTLFAIIIAVNIYLAITHWEIITEKTREAVARLLKLLPATRR